MCRVEKYCFERRIFFISVGIYSKTMHNSVNFKGFLGGTKSTNSMMLSCEDNSLKMRNSRRNRFAFALELKIFPTLMAYVSSDF